MKTYEIELRSTETLDEVDSFITAKNYLNRMSEEKLNNLKSKSKDYTNFELVVNEVIRNDDGEIITRELSSYPITPDCHTITAHFTDGVTAKYKINLFDELKKKNDIDYITDGITGEVLFIK